MKRLQLKDFKAKRLTDSDKVKTEELLGQVLGDCHDDKSCCIAYDLDRTVD